MADSTEVRGGFQEWNDVRWLSAKRMSMQKFL